MRSSLVGAALLGACLLAAAPAARAAPAVAPMELAEPLAHYKLYVMDEIDALVERTRLFTDAVKRGDLGAARALYAPARVHYERVEPIAELFSDLDGSIDSRADDHAAAEEDPEFTGFHRLEHGLWARGSTAGLAPFADRLMRDVEDLRARVAELTTPPDKVVGGAAALIEEVAATKISGEENRYSGTDLWDFHSNMEGARRIVDLFRPLLDRADPVLLRRIGGNFDAVDAILAKYRTAEGGFRSYDTLSQADRNALQGPITVLAEDLSRLRGTLGLS